MWWTRLKALIVKELLAVLRDPRARIILIVPPVIQLVVFSYAATLEVRNVDVMVLNRDSRPLGLRTRAADRGLADLPQGIVHPLAGGPA